MQYQIKFTSFNKVFWFTYDLFGCLFVVLLIKMATCICTLFFGICIWSHKLSATIFIINFHVYNLNAKVCLDELTRHIEKILISYNICSSFSLN